LVIFVVGQKESILTEFLNNLLDRIPVQKDSKSISAIESRMSVLNAVAWVMMVVFMVFCPYMLMNSFMLDEPFSFFDRILTGLQLLVAVCAVAYSSYSLRPNPDPISVSLHGLYDAVSTMENCVNRGDAFSDEGRDRFEEAFSQACIQRLTFSEGVQSLQSELIRTKEEQTLCAKCVNFVVRSLARVRLSRLEVMKAEFDSIIGSLQKQFNTMVKGKKVSDGKRRSLGRKSDPDSPPDSLLGNWVNLRWLFSPF